MRHLKLYEKDFYLFMVLLIVFFIFSIVYLIKTGVFYGLEIDITAIMYANFYLGFVGGIAISMVVIALLHSFRMYYIPVGKKKLR